MAMEILPQQQINKMSLGEAPGETPPVEKKSNLVFFVIAGVFVVFILTGITIYMILNYSNSNKIISPIYEVPKTIVTEPVPPVEIPAKDVQTELLKSQSTGTEVSDIEKDLNNTNLENLDLGSTDFDALFE